MNEDRKSCWNMRMRIGAILAMSAVVGICLGAITTKLFAKSNPNEPMPSLDLPMIILALLGVVSMTVLINYVLEKSVVSDGWRAKRTGPGQ
jgi:TRAP-type C4-dicarboxylate transport system permease small subunit